MQLEYRCWWDPSLIFSSLAQLLPRPGRRHHPQKAWMVLDHLTSSPAPWDRVDPSPSPLEEGATLILLDRGQTAEPPQKVLPESCGHQDDRPRLVPACPIPGDSEGHHGGDRPRSNHLAQLASKPSWPQPSSSSSSSSPGWGCGDPRGCLPSGFALTPTSTPKLIPSPQATSQCPLSTHPGTKWDNGGGFHPGTGAPRPDLPPPCSFWANPCPQRCR